MNYIRNFFSLIRAYGWQMAFATLLLIIMTGIDLVFPEIIRRVIDFGLQAGQSQTLIIAVLSLLGLGLVKAIISFRQQYIAEKIANQVGFDLRNRLYDHIQRLSFSFHDHMPTGQLISRIIEDVRALQNFAGHGMMELARVIFLLVGILTIIFSRNTTLALISLAPLIPLVLVTGNYGRRVGKIWLDVDNTIGELSSIIQENVAGVQVVRAFAREDYEINIFQRINKKLFNRQVTVVREWSKVMPTTIVLITVGTILLLWFGGKMVLRGEISLGELVAFNSYMLLLAAPVQQLAWLVNSGGEAFAGLKRTFEILETNADIQSPPQPKGDCRVLGKVEFNNVVFNYINEKNPALHQINLNVEPNQVVALIGPTGSGKTTLVNLILRFYDVSSGTVLIDGIDVRDYDLKVLRQQIGIVLQSSLLFSTSIFENIAYGKPGVSREEVITAAKAAQAHEFIEELPHGYETVVGEKGITLSGGQRQRVAIARALLLNPRILILDDSTSSVDMQTEHLIQQAMHNLMENRTTFVIAQRLSTIKRANLILVMDRGSVVESGTHRQLLALNGLYRQIYELQLRDQDEINEGSVALEVEYIPVQTSRSLDS